MTVTKPCSEVQFSHLLLYAKSLLTGPSLNNVKREQEGNFLSDFLMRSHTVVVLKSQWKAYLFRTVYHLDSLGPIDPFHFLPWVICSLLLETALLILQCSAFHSNMPTHLNTHSQRNSFLFCLSLLIFHLFSCHSLITKDWVTHLFVSYVW